VRKVLLEHAVHLGEVRHVVKEDVDLDDFLNGCVGLLENRDNVLAALCRLVGDAAFDQSTGLVGRDLTRDEDLGTGDDSLGLGDVSAVVEGVIAVLRGGVGLMQVWAVAREEAEL
jgi:hypothetical protein